jgi:hypothetical protein
LGIVFKLHLKSLKKKLDNSRKQEYLMIVHARVASSFACTFYIDICIEKGKIRTLFELSGFCQDLEGYDLQLWIRIPELCRKCDAIIRAIDNDKMAEQGGKPGRKRETLGVSSRRL